MAAPLITRLVSLEGPESQRFRAFVLSVHRARNAGSGPGQEYVISGITSGQGPTVGSRRVCRRERLLGPCEVPLSQPDVAELREQPAELPSHPRPGVVEDFGAARDPGVRMG